MSSGKLEKADGCMKKEERDELGDIEIAHEIQAERKE